MVSKAERKRMLARHRQRERAARRLARLALLFALTSALGLAGVVASFEADLGLIEWLAGPTGVLGLVGVGLLVRREQVAPRGWGIAGRVAIGSAAVYGLVLLAAQALLLASQAGPGTFTAVLALVPAVLAVGLVVAELAGPGGRDDGSTSQSMTYLSQLD